MPIGKKLNAQAEIKLAASTASRKTKIQKSRGAPQHEDGKRLLASQIYWRLRWQKTRPNHLLVRWQQGRWRAVPQRHLKTFQVS